jgi:hypothetical protein
MEPKDRWAAFRRGPLAYVAASLLLLIPCYWQPRLQGGDLSSHIYKAWMTQLVESGRAEGLMMVRQTTNILFDIILDGLFKVLGAEAAQRIAVSIAVLTFIWGAFAFISIVAGRRAWCLMPCIAMLAYGWVFHMGFFNFYLSLGLSFWGMAIAWDLTPKRLVLAAPAFVLAYMAHVLPMAWMSGILCYLLVARRLKPAKRAYLTAGIVGGLAGLHGLVGRLMVTHWSVSQITLTTGLDQVWVFDKKYYLVLLGLTAIWSLLFLGLVRNCGPREVVASIPFHLCVIGAATVFVLPGTVFIPGFSHTLSYIAERMSLGVAVCVLALLGMVPPRQLERWALIAVCAVFFVFVYVDEKAMNSFEDRMQDLFSSLRPAQSAAGLVAGPARHPDLSLMAALNPGRPESPSNSR